jgi:hypothetical protein
VAGLVVYPGGVVTMITPFCYLTCLAEEPADTDCAVVCIAEEEQS